MSFNLKYSIFPFIAILFLTSSNLFCQNNHVKEVPWKGTKTVRTKIYYINQINGKNVELPKELEWWEHEYNSLKIYNENGIQTEIIYYDSDNSIRKRIVNLVDANGNCIKTTEYDSHDSIISFEANMHNSNGDLIESIKYDSDGGLIEKQIYKDDKEGNSITLRYDMNGILIEKSLRKLDDYGNPAEWTELDAAGGVQSRNVFIHDSNSNLLSWSVYFNNRLSYKYTYDYDDHGNNSVMYSWNSDGSLFGKDIYIYDLNDNRIEHYFYYADGTLMSKNIMKYDKKNHLIEDKKYELDDWSGQLRYIQRKEYIFTDY